MLGRVNNKVAFVTGGSRGIGAETARLLAAEGATVIIVDTLKEQGEELAQQIKGEFYSLNVSKESEWEKISHKVREKFGRIDILFNNAGVLGLEKEYKLEDIEDSDLKNWERVHSINLGGVFLGCKYGIPLMKEYGGAIINMSSRSGIVGVPGLSAYASSKAAVLNYTRSVALYCAKKNYQIRCNALLPGAILTKLWDPIIGSDENVRAEKIESISLSVPLGRMGRPRDVAYAVLYLGSDESSYITGAGLNIDGGILAQGRGPV